MISPKSNSNEGKSLLDTFKLLLVLALLAVGIGGFYWYADAPQYVRIPGLLAVVIAAAAVLFTTTSGHSLLAFARDARVELRKVVWPTRQETTQTTLVVLVLVLIVGIFLWLIDMFLLWGVNRLMGLGG